MPISTVPPFVHMNRLVGKRLTVRKKHMTAALQLLCPNV